MAHHRQSFAIGEMAMPLVETPEQQRIMELEEQLDQEKESHKETKFKLEVAEIKLSDRTSEVGGLKNTIHSLVLRDQTSYEKFQQNDDFKAEIESKLQIMKMEMDKKFDDLEEQISKGQMQEELQKLRKLNDKLETENARLQEELSDSVTETKWLNECIEKFDESDGKNEEKIEELMKTIRQDKCEIDELEKELSDVKNKLEKRDLKYEKLKNKYEEAVVKFNDQLQHQLQQEQQFDKNAEDSQIQTASLLSKEIKECVSAYEKYLDALRNKDTQLYSKLTGECSRTYNSLSKEDQEKCLEIANKSRQDFMMKQNNV